jgi:hypothetical protein
MKNHKKLHAKTIIFALCLFSALSGATAFAAELYPLEVQENGTELVRIYELGPKESTEDIPRDSFERGGSRYELTEIIKQETELTDTVQHSETITIDTATKELEEILPLLAPTMDFVSEDGYAGTLLLDVAGIVTEVAGTKQSAYTLTISREYPHLTSNDTSLLPKTVTERGLTYTLATDDWKSENSETVDYDTLPEYYTAIANYTASGTSTKVTGYTTTAIYNGVITKQLEGKIRYSAHFEGSPIAMPAPIETPTPNVVDETSQDSVNVKLILFIVGGVLLLSGSGYFAYTKLKGKIRKF